MKKIVHAACIVFGSKWNSKEVGESLAFIQSQTQNLPSKDNVVDKERDRQDNTHDDTGDNDIFDFANHALSMSPFKDILDKERIKANEKIRSSIDTLTHTVPIWSDLLSGDLQRFSKNYQMQINACKKSTATVLVRHFSKTQKCCFSKIRNTELTNL